MDAELEKFKNLNLGNVAACFGYTKDRDSSKNSLKMRGQDGDKLIVATDRTDGHSIYFSTSNPKDCGSVIDFVQRRLGQSLGEVRKWIRGYLSNPQKDLYQKPLPSSKTDRDLMLELEGMSKEPSKYLMEDRKISLETLEDPRFKDRVLVNQRGSAIFPHYADGLSGYEVKGKDFTGFSPGGEKGLWFSEGLEVSRKIVICESAVDCLSHAELKKDTSVGYISIAGTLSDKQKRELSVLARASESRGFEIVIAVDRDKGGEKIKEDLSQIFKKSSVDVSHSKDWNEDLKETKLEVERAKVLERSRGREIEFEM